MKTSRVVGYVAVAFAYAPACGGSAPSMPVSTADDGGAEASGNLASGADTGAGDDGSLVSGGSEAGALDGATYATPNAGPDRSCCVSGVYYACPSQAALQQCAGFDVTACFESCAATDAACERACGQKASMASTDPSACVHDASKDALCAFDAGSGSSSSSNSSSSGSRTPAPAPAPPPTPPPTSKNACGGPFLGTQCTAGLQCIGGGHCSQNKCYPNDVGNPCTFPNDCGDGNHCTAGCCASPAKGSACSTGLDCTSKTCTGGVCQ